MSRSIAWAEDAQNPRWICSECAWSYPLPTLLTAPEAREAFNRLAQSRFEQHRCADYPKPAAGVSLGQESFADRVRKFITRGYKPKDAVQVVLDEIMLEHRGQPGVIEKAKLDAQDFLRQLREGRI